MPNPPAGTLLYPAVPGGRNYNIYADGMGGTTSTPPTGTVGGNGSIFQPAGGADPGLFGTWNTPAWDPATMNSIYNYQSLPINTAADLAQQQYASNASLQGSLAAAAASRANAAAAAQASMYGANVGALGGVAQQNISSGANVNIANASNQADIIKAAMGDEGARLRLQAQLALQAQTTNQGQQWNIAQAYGSGSLFDNVAARLAQRGGPLPGMGGALNLSPVSMVSAPTVGGYSAGTYLDQYKPANFTPGTFKPPAMPTINTGGGMPSGGAGDIGAMFNSIYGNVNGAWNANPVFTNLPGLAGGGTVYPTSGDAAAQARIDANRAVVARNRSMGAPGVRGWGTQYNTAGSHHPLVVTHRGRRKILQNGQWVDNPDYYGNQSPGAPPDAVNRHLTGDQNSPPPYVQPPLMPPGMPQPDFGTHSSPYVQPPLMPPGMPQPQSQGTFNLYVTPTGQRYQALQPRSPGDRFLAAVPGLAEGGTRTAGQMAWVGEKGPELMIVKPDHTQIIPMNQLRGMAGGGSIYSQAARTYGPQNTPQAQRDNPAQPHPLGSTSPEVTINPDGTIKIGSSINAPNADMLPGLAGGGDVSSGGVLSDVNNTPGMFHPNDKPGQSIYSFPTLSRPELGITPQLDPFHAAAMYDRALPTEQKWYLDSLKSLYGIDPANSIYDMNQSRLGYRNTPQQALSW